MKNAVGVLTGITQIALGTMDILAIFLPVNEQSVYFHLFISYLISLISIL